MSRSPALGEVLNFAIENAMQDLYISLPGKVTSYDSSAQSANVQPLIKVPYQTETGVRKLENLPVIPGVPIIFPGGGGFVVQFPMSVGDTVLLVFSAASLDKWLASGGGPLDPESDSRHAFADAVAIPGLRDFRHARAQVATDLTLGADGGIQVHVSQADIKLGTAAVDAIIKGTTYRAAEDTMLGLVAAAFTALAAETSLSASAAASTAAAGGITTFLTAAAAYLSAIAKVQ